MKYKKLLEEIEELKEAIERKKEQFIPRELESEYIKSIIELMKIQAIILIQEEIKKMERRNKNENN